jgi:hypothetical protein
VSVEHCGLCRPLPLTLQPDAMLPTLRRKWPSISIVTESVAPIAPEPASRRAGSQMAVKMC